MYEKHPRPPDAQAVAKYAHLAGLGTNPPLTARPLNALPAPSCIFIHDSGVLICLEYELVSRSSLMKPRAVWRRTRAESVTATLGRCFFRVELFLTIGKSVNPINSRIEI